MRLILLSILALLLTAEESFSQKTKIETNRFLCVKNGKYGVTDSLNKTIVPFLYEHIEYKNSRLIVRKKGLHGLLTINNDVIVPVAYQFILPRGNDRFILWTLKPLFGLCDNNGKIILPVKYKNISSIEKDDFYITRNDKNLNGAYTFAGENVLPEIYKFYTRDGYKVFAVKDGQPLILDLQKPDNAVLLDRDITLVETSRHYSIGEQFFQIVRKQNKYGVINASNQTVIPIIYEEVKSSQDWRYFIIKENGKVGLINVNGNIVKEPIFDAIELRKEYIVLKQKNKKDEIYSYE